MGFRRTSGNTQDGMRSLVRVSPAYLESSRDSLATASHAHVAARVLKTHGQSSSSPRATPSEFIAEAIDRRPPSGVKQCVVRLLPPSLPLTIVQTPNVERPPRNGPGTSVLRAKVLPTVSSQRFLSFVNTLPSVLSRARAQYSSAEQDETTVSRCVTRFSWKFGILTML